MNIEAVSVFIGAGFVFGWITANFVYGRSKYCNECWVALVNGKRYEEGCENCAMRCYNDRINH